MKSEFTILIASIVLLMHLAGAYARGPSVGGGFALAPQGIAAAAPQSTGGGFALTPRGGPRTTSALTGGGFTLVGGVDSTPRVPTSPVCAGDLDGNLQVDSDDLGILLGSFGTASAGDLDGDGDTDSDDLGVLLGAFGAECK